MVSFFIRLKFNSEDRADMAEVARLLANESRREPGCVSFIPHQAQDDPDTLVIYEQYRDENAVNAHRESPHFKKYVVGELYQRMKDRSRENLIALV